MPNAAALDIKILATDIDPRVVAEGQRGVYGEAALADVPDALRKRYFVCAPGKQRQEWMVADELRRLVSFRTLNLNADWPMPGKFAAIFCRNVVIYFDEPTQQRVWSKFASKLEPERLALYRPFRTGDRAAASRFVSDGVTAYRLERREQRMKPVRVLVVDNSATMRGLISAALSSDAEIVVVGQAADPLEAREAIKALNPDVMTLDVEMPKMDGLEFLDKVMRLEAVSRRHGLEPDGARRERDDQGDGTRRRRLHRQTVDRASPFLRRSAGPSEDRRRTRACTSGRTTRRAPARRADDRAACEPCSPYRPDGEVVAIGASTGGVEALIAILTGYPTNCPPTVITLHMPTPFTKSFARTPRRTDRRARRRSRRGAPLDIGRVYLAPGSATHLEVSSSSHWRCRLQQRRSRQRPSSVGRRSVRLRGQVVRPKAVGVILTGMGRDGAEGIARHAPLRGEDDRPERSDQHRLRHAEGRLRVRGGREQMPLGDIGTEILGLTSALKRKELSNVAGGKTPGHGGRRHVGQPSAHRRRARSDGRARRDDRQGRRWRR